MHELVDACLDRASRRLHDAEALWSRTELLDWWRDGYRELLARSQGVRRFRAIPLPPRHAFSVTREWEDRHTASTQVRKPSMALAAAFYQMLEQWEVEAAVSIVPTASLRQITQEWERAFLGATAEGHYRFAFPRNHERVVRLTWQGKRLIPIAVRDLDELDTEWWNQVGRPQYWTAGTGRVKDVEIYQIVTDYVREIEIVGEPSGLPRKITGTRTWAVEANPQFPGGSPRVWSYSYATQGDAQALASPHQPFAPRMAVTRTWELEYAEKPAWVFTIDLVMNFPERTTTGTQPWELGGSAGATRGMFPWERLDPAKGYESTVYASADEQVSLTSFHPDGLPVLGLRFTPYTSASGTIWATQPWEVDIVDGKTAFRAGATIGTGYFEGQLGYAPVVNVGLGTWRMVTSPDRQYLPIIEDQTTGVLRGRPVEINSDIDCAMALEVVLPDVELDEQGSAALIPPQLEKYICWYMLGKAFSRIGEGHNAILADHYMRRFRRGVEMLTRMLDVAHRDRVLAREPTSATDGRPPRVRLPSTFERIG